jgi:methionyl aminopeptidase
MSIETAEELERLRAVGRVVAAALRAMRRAVRAGVTTGELDGFYADACVTVGVGRIRGRDAALIATANRALASGIGAARAGAPLNAIGATIEETVSERGLAVCRELMGHGIGRRLHEQPDVPSVYVPQLTESLTDGLVMTIEPIVSAGSGRVLTNPDGWTVRTADGARASHAEHTIVVRDGAPLVLTR